MKSQLSPRLALLLLSMAIGLAACGADDPVTGPTPFRVVLQVNDSGGLPVAGLELGLAPDSPWYMDGAPHGRSVARQLTRLGQPYPSPFHPAVIIPFALAQAADARLTVDDIESSEIRVLLDEPFAAGEWITAWNSRDEAGDPVTSGVYFAHLVLRDVETSELLLDESLPMLFATFLPDPLNLGITDQSGQLVLRDKRLFPNLYDVPDFPAVDETGERVGTISLTSTMRFYLTDPVADRTRRFDREVAGPGTLRLTWIP